MVPSRRRFLAFAGASATLALWPRGPAWAARDDARLLVVLLRGGLDALHATPRPDDPHYARLRGALAIEGARPLAEGFALHPALAFAHGLYGRGQLLPVVAVAPPYRGRSHFEAQDCLESGSGASGGGSTGWLNRCVAAMSGTRALAIAAVTPLAVRGPGPATTWSPPLPGGVNPSLLQRLAPLYAADPMLGERFAEAVRRSDGDRLAPGAMRLPQAMQAAARFMGEADGPRVAFVEDSGWDTHSAQTPVLARKLAELDAGLRAFHDGAAALWKDTVIAVVTEFGRTVAANGTGGTDHGTGGLALLAGGAVRGGRIAGDWPGLAPSALFEGRDLRTTADLRGLFKGLLREHLHLSDAAIEGQVFPDSREAKPLAGLVA